VVLGKTPFEKGTSEWLESRSGTVCASEVASLLGLDQYVSRKRTLEVKRGAAPQKMSSVSKKMCEWGRAMETVAICRLQSDHLTPDKGYDCYWVQPGSLQHSVYPWFVGAPDAVFITGLLDDVPLPVEIKCRSYPSPAAAIPYQDKYEIPVKHIVQIECYMELLGCGRAILYNWTPNNGSTAYNVYKDAEFFDRYVVPELYDFYNLGPEKMRQRVRRSDKARLMAKLNDMIRVNVAPFP
jgi:predicted phage-related endonuclease